MVGVGAHPSLFLGPGGDDDLAGAVVKLVIPLELADHGLLEFRRAIHRGIAGLASSDGVNGRLFDVLWGVEIRLASAKAYNVPASGLEFRCPGGHRDGGRWFDGLDASCQIRVQHILLPAFPDGSSKLEVITIEDFVSWQYP